MENIKSSAFILRDTCINLRIVDICGDLVVVFLGINFFNRPLHKIFLLFCERDLNQQTENKAN